MHSRLLIIFIILSSPLTYSQAAGTDATKEKWYQIELFIYASNDTHAQENEQWQQYPSLHYPLNSRLLTPDYTTTKLDGPLPSTLNNQVQQSPLIYPGTTNPQQSFTLLPKDEFQLGYAARRILAQADFRPLFHGAWRQVIESRENADSIVITGGGQFDNHFELEGTITLGVNRYLHIETDLWLSSFTNNTGLKESPWQALPKRPVPIAPDTSGHTLSNSEPMLVQKPESVSTSTITATRQSNSNLTDIDPPAEYSAGTDELGSSRLKVSGSAQNSLSHDTLQELFGNQYAVESTVALRQKRRMRSNELHYIDHPSMGLLIKIIPYELPKAELEDLPQKPGWSLAVDVVDQQ